MAAPPPEARPILGALAVVLRDDQVILAKRERPSEPAHWGFPGGHVELGETALKAAARELREETGVIARPLEYLTCVDVLRFDGAGQPVVHYLLAAVLCEYVEGTPVADDDVEYAMWVPFETITGDTLALHADVQRVAELARRRLRALADMASDART
ncbi:MAG: NUDIX hydrolase [Paracoccaceae bacterium]